MCVWIACDARAFVRLLHRTSKRLLAIGERTVGNVFEERLEEGDDPGDLFGPGIEVANPIQNLCRCGTNIEGVQASCPADSDTLATENLSQAGKALHRVEHNDDRLGVEHRSA